MKGVSSPKTYSSGGICYLTQEDVGAQSLVQLGKFVEEETYGGGPEMAVVPRHSLFSPFSF